MSNLKFNIEQLCVSVLKVNRFWSTVLAKMRKVEDKHGRIKTAGVCLDPKGNVIFLYNPKFIYNLVLSYAQGVTIHEVCHVFFKHLTRFVPTGKPDYDHAVNIGLDLSINQHIKDKDGNFLIPVEEGCYPEKFGLEQDQHADYYVAEMLKKLEEEQQKQQQQQQQQQQDSDQDSDDDQDQDDQGGGDGDDDQDQDDDGDQDGQGDQDGDGDQDGQGGGDQDGDKVGSHELWGKVYDEKTGEISEAKEHDIDPESKLGKIIKDSISECRDYGKLPDFIKKEIERITAVKRHDWKKELHQFENKVLAKNKKTSEKRVNRRYTELDFFMPGKKKGRRPVIIVARDLSWSCNDDSVQEMYLNEMIQMNGRAELIVMDFDTIVHQVHRVKKRSDFKDPIGGGGTSFVHIFEVARQYNADAIFCLTDTYGEFPDKSKIGKYKNKTCWVTFNQETIEVPFGKHINITVD
jgi:predicted metal-dependent peptidase